VVWAATETSSPVSNMGSRSTAFINRVYGNLIGTDVTGTDRLGNYAGVASMAHVTQLAATIPQCSGRNIISGNNIGVGLYGARNLVQSNFIGTDVTGTLPLGNSYDGVHCHSVGNTGGWDGPSAGNVISGTATESYWKGSPETVCKGNMIGTDLSGLIPLGNSWGVRFYSSVNNLIGGTVPAAGNKIYFNSLQGVGR